MKHRVSPLNCTSLLKSWVVSVSSNGVTNNLKKVERKKRAQNSQIICKLGVCFFDASTCEATLG